MSYTLYEIDVATDGSGAGTNTLEPRVGRLAGIAVRMVVVQPAGVNVLVQRTFTADDQWTLLDRTGNTDLPVQTPGESVIDNTGTPRADWFVQPLLVGPVTVTVTGGAASGNPAVKVLLVVQSE